MRTRTMVSVGAAAVGLVATALAAAPVASAAPAASTATQCETNFVCLYYHSSDYATSHGGNYGAVMETAANISDFKDWYFYKSAYGSDGAGLSVKNNAAYVTNWHPTKTYRVYYNSGYSCVYACQDIHGAASADLNSQLKNNDASGKFL